MRYVAERERFEELSRKLENDEEPLEEAEQWLIEFKEISRQIDPTFYESDFMWGMEEHMEVRRKAREISAEQNISGDRESLIKLANSIIISEKTQENMDLLEIDAKYYLLQKYIIHPKLHNLIAEINLGKTAEQVIDEALAYKPIYL